MSAAAVDILARLKAAGLTVIPDRADSAKVYVSPRERLTDELLNLIRQHKADILAELRTRPAEPAYTRCLDCTHYIAPPPDVAFWCPLVRGRPTLALWAICTGYEPMPGILPGPTVPQDSEGEQR